MDINLASIALLCLTGFFAGAINTVAGGGSNLTLPVLMMLGLPADIANGSNRVAVMLQCLVGLRGYDKNNSLDRPALIPILIPTMSGGLIGALAAAVLPNLYLKPLLLGTILCMSLIILVRPSMIAHSPDTVALTPDESRMGWWGLFAAGVYGGFVQAGVGFILIAALAGGLRYDLVRSNALKMAITVPVTVVALAVYVLRDQVQWIPGLVLAIGMVIGAMASVQFAINVPQSVLKWVMFSMVLLVCLAAFFT